MTAQVDTVTAATAGKVASLRAAVAELSGLDSQIVAEKAARAANGFELTPFWLGYAVALAVCVGWAWRLSRESKERDAETEKRDADIPREAMWRAIDRERGE